MYSTAFPHWLTPDFHQWDQDLDCALPWSSATWHTMSINMVELFFRIIFISLEFPLPKIQPAIMSSKIRNPITRPYPSVQDWYSIRYSQGTHSQYWTSVRLSSPRQWESQTCTLSMFTAAKSISKLHDSLYIPPLAKVSPPLPAQSRFSEWLCLWEFRVWLWGLFWGCRGGVYACTCRSVSTIRPRTGNLLPVILPFPHTFFPFAYPKKPVHCQNSGILF